MGVITFFSNIRRLGFLIIPALFVAGCATTAPTSNRLTLWNIQRAQNENISAWDLNGKIGVKTGKKGGSATLNWDYTRDSQAIELYGPFGGGRVHINVNPGSALLEDTKGLEIQGLSAQDVLYERLGWHVPFAQLVYWSRGLPDEDAREIVIDDFGRLQSLKQGIWFVEYQAYRNIRNYILPRKFTIKSLPGTMEVYDDDGNDLGDDFSVKVILKRWREIEAE